MHVITGAPRNQLALGSSSALSSSLLKHQPAGGALRLPKKKNQYVLDPAETGGNAKVP